MPAILATRDRQTMTLSMNRPERLNAVNEQLYSELIATLVEADADASVRAIVLTGSGRAFCVGADLKEHKAGSRSEQDQADYVALGQRACEQIQTMSTPVIAAVNGYALGAGAEMAIGADFLVIGAEAQMAFPEVSIGTFVGGGVTHRLPRLIGLRKATEVLFFGNRFTGRQAFDWGLANTVVPDESVLSAAQTMAAELARKAPLSMAMMKSELNRTDSLDDALEREASSLLEAMGTEDWAEGVEAFATRRAPVFKGW